MNVREEVITPDIARDYLLRNKVNRPLNQATVEHYARQMKEGKWLRNGDPIQFLENGYLGNGQHRLNAIVKANIPVTLLVVHGCDNNSFCTYDQNRKRTVGDIFMLHNVPNAVKISAIVNRYVLISITKPSAFISGGTGYKTSMASNNSITQNYERYTPEELFEVYSMNPNLFQQITKDVQAYRKKCNILTETEMGGIMAYLVLDKNYEYEFASSFFEMLCNLNAQQNITINTLREKLYKDRISTTKMTSRYKSQILIKAWNAYATNKDLKIISWNEAKEGNLQFI